MFERIVRQLLSPKLPAKWSSRCLADPVIVLGYHGLRPSGKPSSWLQVEVGTFREQLRLLLQRGRFVDPPTLEESHDGSTGRLRFLLTFDDGYRNVLELGVPVMNEFGISALFFVSTHHLLTGEPFWFDRIVSPVQATRLDSLDLRRFGLGNYRFHPHDGARRWGDIQRVLVDVKRLGNPGTRTVDNLLDHIEATVGGVALPLPVRPEDLKGMTPARTCSVGSHGHRHAIMTRLGEDELSRELTLSRRTLEEVVGTPVCDVAYPNGDCDTRVIQACRAAGYKRGFTTGPGVFSDRVDLFRIPRLLVGGYDSARAVVAKVNETLLTEAIRRIRRLGRAAADRR